MINEIITTLHPDQDPDTNLYPNIKKENIPDGSVDDHKLDPNYVSSIDNRFNDVNEKVDNLQGGQPKYVNTSTNILILTENKGIAVATDNGHWYYWDGSHYVDGGVYQAYATGSVEYNSLDDQLKNDIDLIENFSNAIKIDLSYVTGNYVSNDGNWRSASIFGVAIVDVRNVKKLVYKTDTLNQYLSNVAFSYDKEIGSGIIAYSYFDTLGYKIINIPDDVNYAFITKPVDTNGVTGNSILYGFLSNEKISNGIDNAYIDEKLGNETHNYVTGNVWTSGSLFGTFKEIALHNAKKIIYINRVANNYIKQVIFTKNNNYNSANIILTATYGLGEHIIDVPDGAKYVYITTPYDSNGNRGDDPTLYIPVNSVVSKDYEDIPYAIPNSIVTEPYTDLKVYIDNLYSCTNKKDLSVNLNITTSLDRSSQFNEYINFNAIAQSNIEYSINFYKDNVLEKVKNITINYKNLTKSNKKVLVIGDSTIAGVGATNDGAETNYMLQEFDNASAILTLIGTLGDGDNKYEGRPGWSIYNYLTTSENNPFYNPNTNDFDLDYYLTNNDLDTPDYVVIQLGINDMFFGNDRIDSVISSTYNNLKYMINKILSYNNSIKILYNLVITPKNDQNVFTQDYGIGVKAFQCKYNFLKFNEYVIDNLENDINDDRLILVPTNVITTSSDMYNSVHPNDSGYEKIAKIVCTYLWDN